MSDAFLSHSDAALLNRNLVLRYIRSQGRVSRTDIWKSMAISRASVTMIVRQMQESGLITEVPAPRSEARRRGKGRSVSRYLCLNEGSRLMYIFEWGSRTLCLVNLGASILDSLQLSFPPNCMPLGFAQVVLQGIGELRKKHPVDPEALLGLGLVMPGLIDSRSQTVLHSVELGWRNVDMCSLFQTAFGNNIFLERTSHMIALGEFEFGMARTFNHILLVLMENEGIGASVVVRGDCQHGHNYMHGELGHIKLPEDVPCSCGQRGCLEAVVRYHLMRNGNQVDDALLDYYSMAISTAVNLYDPGIVLLSGRLVRNLGTENRDLLIERICCRVTDGHLRDLTFGICREETHMGIRGMSAHIFNHHFAV